MSLDDIWDAPVVSPAKPTSTKDASSPVKRPRQSLFLSDSDSDYQRPQKRATLAPDPDIEALFADIDENAADTANDEEDLTYKPLAPALDLEKLSREAEARHARERKTKIPASSATRQVASSSPPPPDAPSGRGAKTNGDGGKGKGGDDEGKKERKRPLYLDEERLIGPSGLPQLIKDIKGFKPKGKGHEHSDLNRLLQVYQFWTHRMYPKTPFRDTINRVEKLCHSKRMQVRLSVWRDESKGLVNGKNPEPEDHDLIDLTEGDPKATEHDMQEGKSDELLPSRAPSLPPMSSEPEDDDFDMEAVIKAEEERLAALRAANDATPTSAPKPLPSKDKGDGTDTMDEEAMWAALDDQPLSDRPPDNATKAPTILTHDQDEEMWDIVNELEQGEQEQQARSGSSRMVTEMPISCVVFASPTKESNGGNVSRATNDEGWDEMYL
ncbi:replication fork protection component Swi3-domain-containing protein [Pisolithus marmoratus]|nr:replication fork protection component Swi3-domain-containing protein [Pisolithus marmoratus]